jgi:hypothetical protein
MTTESKKQKTQPSNPKTQDKRRYKRDEQKPTNLSASKQRDQQGSDQGVKPTQPPKSGRYWKR